MVIEVHFLDKMANIEFVNPVYVIFEKILKSFRIAHLHRNNCFGRASIESSQVPRVLE